ncbi:MAG: hypothetical protein M1819_003697 [Sarea resinae]|nr:MAG: hypothetical protein M1819_003697 [Sarea resinae]
MPPAVARPSRKHSEGARKNLLLAHWGTHGHFSKDGSRSDVYPPIQQEKASLHGPHDPPIEEPAFILPSGFGDDDDGDDDSSLDGQEVSATVPSVVPAKEAPSKAAKSPIGEPTTPSILTLIVNPVGSPTAKVKASQTAGAAVSIAKEKLPAKAAPTLSLENGGIENIDSLHTTPAQRETTDFDPFALARMSKDEGSTPKEYSEAHRPSYLSLGRTDGTTSARHLQISTMGGDIRIDQACIILAILFAIAVFVRRRLLRSQRTERTLRLA